MPKPLIIYIAETDHKDKSYPAITERIIKECEAKGLKTAVLSEFGNKEKGLGSEDEKSVVGYFPKEEVNKFVNERCTPMGNVFERFTKLIPDARASLPENVTPSKAFEKFKDEIDNPEVLELFEAEINLRKRNQRFNFGQGYERNSTPKDFENFWENGNAFVQKTTHKKMAQDVISKTKGDEDVIIMIAGAAHIYGLNKELGSEFDSCQKLVVGNFSEKSVELDSINLIKEAQGLVGKKSCEKVGEIVGFDKETLAIPDVVAEKIKNRAGLKQASREVGDVIDDLKGGLSADAGSAGKEVPQKEKQNSSSNLHSR